MKVASSYLMESASEAERLEAKTREHVSLQQLELVGLQPGMRALDVGSGTGAVARAMAGIVGERGSVVAFDASHERLHHGAALAQQAEIDNLRFVAGDLYAPALRPASFDFIWCRYVFQYLRDPAAALDHLIALAKPGGKIVVGDLDGYGLFHHPCPPELVEGLAKLERAFAGRFDPFAGRKLYPLFHQAGLQNICVHLLPHHLYAGRASDDDLANWEMKFRTLRRAGSLAFGGEAPYDSFVRNFLDFLASPSTFTYSVLLLVEGLRPLGN